MKLRQLLNDPSETPAVLCGAGISFEAGLPTATGLYDLFENYAADAFAKTLFIRHRPGPQQDIADLLTPNSVRRYLGRASASVD